LENLENTFIEHVKLLDPTFMFHKYETENSSLAEKVLN